MFYLGMGERRVWRQHVYTKHYNQKARTLVQQLCPVGRVWIAILAELGRLPWLSIKHEESGVHSQTRGIWVRK